MTLSLSQALGILLVAVPLVGIFIYSVKSMGMWDALFCFAVGNLISFSVVFGLYLALHPLE